MPLHLRNTFYELSEVSSPRIRRSHSWHNLEISVDPDKTGGEGSPLYRTMQNVYTPTKEGITGSTETDLISEHSISISPLTSLVYSVSNPALNRTDDPDRNRRSRRFSLASPGKTGLLGHTPYDTYNSSPLDALTNAPQTNHLLSTIMIRNIPAKVTPSLLFDIIISEGFGGQFDFLYLPVDLITRSSLGYAFVNLISISKLKRFTETFHRKALPTVTTTKICQICTAKVQGFQNNLDVFTNSVSVAKLPDDFKPIALIQNDYVPFPDKNGNTPLGKDFAAPITAH
jgi:hypothetical protein